ncbi:acylphosphatase [Fusobacterium sp. MFO224]|uniref:acylphosphatase n=1 Tax=Fusobacterium sp. MFO224 TaxID=3378070 RepID=UPI00385291ED
MKTFRYIVKGRVQGVGYRFHVGSELREIGAKGYIRNLDDGDVEVLVQIKEEKLPDVEKYIEKGSPYGRVKEVKKSTLEMEECSSFDMRY